ncbi:MAG: hypothetical protein K0R14_116 [Burkholderiales bacterium]|nr:hypothetical protein [Burkholderiales bacterium]
MNNKFKSRAICTHITNQPENNLTQIINGIKVTLGCDPNNLFNLSILGRLKPYQTNKHGYFDVSKPVYDPLSWIKSHTGQEYITKQCGKTEDIIFASSFQHPDKPPVTIYTRSFYLWLGYLKHCIGNIDDAISRA